MNGKSSDSWQVILADLSLILFLTAIAGYGVSDAKVTATRELSIGDDSQAIFREHEGSPDLAEWLTTQSVDPRARLTIVATYSQGNADQVWAKAQQLFDETSQANHNARIVFELGDHDDVYVVIAFDRVETQN